MKDNHKQVPPRCDCGSIEATEGTKLRQFGEYPQTQPPKVACANEPMPVDWMWLPVTDLLLKIGGSIFRRGHGTR